MKAFLFPGQGSQYPNMGLDLYENFAFVRELLKYFGFHWQKHEVTDVRFNCRRTQTGDRAQIAITLQHHHSLFCVNRVWPDLVRFSLANLRPFCIGVINFDQFQDCCKTGKIWKSQQAWQSQKQAGNSAVIDLISLLLQN